MRSNYLGRGGEVADDGVRASMVVRCWGFAGGGGIGGECGWNGSGRRGGFIGLGVALAEGRDAEVGFGGGGGGGTVGGEGTGGFGFGAEVGGKGGGGEGLEGAAAVGGVEDGACGGGGAAFWRGVVSEG